MIVVSDTGPLIALAKVITAAIQQAGENDD